MGIQKLVLDDAWEYDFDLLAIHCSLEDYKMAYLLNSHLGIRLHRCKQDLDVSASGVFASFALYRYHDNRLYDDYHLVANRYRTTSTAFASSGNLFDGRRVQGRTYHFLEELPKVDFLLRIRSESRAFAKSGILATMNHIPQVITAYQVDLEQLKSKNNLIFE